MREVESPMARWLVLAAVVVMMLAACTPRPEILGLDPEAAQKLAIEKTPMTEVTSVDGSHTVPFRHMIRGRDQDGRELIVWVATDITRQIYVDQMLSRDRALEIAAENGISKADVKTVQLGHMFGQGDSVYWDVDDGCIYVQIDVVSGDVLESALSGCRK